MRDVAVARLMQRVPHRRQRVGAARDARRGWTATAAIVFVVQTPLGAPGRPVLDGLAQPREEPLPGDPGGKLSKSATKARIAPGRRRRIVDIPRFFSRLIPARGAFVADSDTPPPRLVPGAPRVPPRSHSTLTISEDTPPGKSPAGTAATPGDSPDGSVSTTPLFVCYAPSLSATLLFLVQRRVKRRSRRKEA